MYYNLSNLRIKSFFIILLSVGAFRFSIAQQSYNSKNRLSDDDDPFEKRTFLMYGLNFVSENVYLGRKDSVALPYLSPYIGFHDRSGLYAKAMISDAPAKHRIDLLTLEAGYDHNLGEHANFGFNVDKFYYNKNSTNIRAASTGSASITGQYTNEWVEPQIGFNLDFNQKTDYVWQIQLDHDFGLAGNKLHLIPTFIFNDGTQNYYDAYFINRLRKQDKLLKLKKVLNKPDEFVPLDYELSIKTTYRVTKWLFTFIPTYVVPLSPASLTLPKQVYTEKLSNSFFVELDICHR